MKQKKVPVRMCVACRAALPKRELMRVVCNKEGMVFADPTGKAAGRGAYICPKTECLEKAKKTRALQRALDCTVDEDTFAELKRAILRREIDKI